MQGSVIGANRRYLDTAGVGCTNEVSGADVRSRVASRAILDPVTRGGLDTMASPAGSGDDRNFTGRTGWREGPAGHPGAVAFRASRVARVLFARFVVVARVARLARVSSFPDPVVTEPPQAARESAAASSKGGGFHRLSSSKGMVPHPTMRK